MLLATFMIPKCLGDAEQLKTEHEQFQVAIEVSSEWYSLISFHYELVVVNDFGLT